MNISEPQDEQAQQPHGNGGEQFIQRWRSLGTLTPREVTMVRESEQARQILQITGLKPTHFADLIRLVQMIFDPSRQLLGPSVRVNWELFAMSPLVLADLKLLAKKYQFSSPNVPIEQIWQDLTPEVRSWFIEYRHDLWQLEELFFALDEN